MAAENPHPFSEADQGGIGAPCPGSLSDDGAFDGQGGAGTVGAQSGSSENHFGVKASDEGGCAGGSPSHREADCWRADKEAGAGYAPFPSGAAGQAEQQPRKMRPEPGYQKDHCPEPEKLRQGEPQVAAEAGLFSFQD